MEKIKQAIEKSRQRAKPKKDALYSISQSHSRSTSAGAAEEIIYSETQIVTVDPEHLEKNRIVAFNKNDPLSVNFDLLRTQVLRKMEKNGWRTLAITSPTPASGKTVVAINLAMSVAHQTEKTAVLVDLDLRRPKVASYLGIQPDSSLNGFFSGEIELSQALYNLGLPRLVVLPTRQAEEKPAELLASRKVGDLVVELRDRYEDRITIIDLPPILNVDDVLSVLPQIDCVLVVVANGESTKEEIQESLRYLPAVNFVGAVLNKTDVDRKAYY